MKNTIYAALAFLMLASACKKNNTAGESENTSSGSLINASTGWQKLATIPYRISSLGLKGSQAMTPYDLTSVGTDLALVYSEDSKLVGTTINNTTYKLKISPTTGTITESTKLPVGGYAIFYTSRFIPNTFTSIFSIVSNSDIRISSEEPKMIAGNNLGYSSIDNVKPINWYPDGGFTMGGKQAGYNISDAFSYTYPQVGNFNVTLNQWSQDNTKWIKTTALRLSGGELNEFIVSYKDDKVFFSIIKDDPGYVPTNGVQHDFFMVARQEIPGLSAANFITNAYHAVIASNVVNNKYTMLLGEFGESSHTIVTKVHCYQWQKGSTEFTKLYGNIAVPEDIGYHLGQPQTIGERPGSNGAPVKFTPDGTAYMLYSSTSSSTNYSALATINASGAKIMGKYQAADHPAGHYDQVGLAVCEYYNGSYYAVAYQNHDNLYPYTDARFRMELVKFTP